MLGSHTTRWLVVGLLLASAAYALAEDITLTTYYPSPRGVYQELRVGGGGLYPAPTGMLHVVKPTDDGNVALRVDDQAADPTPFVIDQNGNVGIGTATPAERLVVNGGIQLGNSTGTNTGTLRWNGTDLQVFDGAAWINIGVPAGTIAFFNAATCPSGWSEVINAQGRYVVGLQPGATPGETVGNALALMGGGVMENRTVSQHTHPLSAAPPLTRALACNWGGVGIAPLPPGGLDAHVQGCDFGFSDVVGSEAVTASTETAGDTIGTTAPYAQLLVCQKD